jgi:anthranilate synthase/aminodeoxychorismate synthase-like glutamine amidotransferase
MATKQKILMVDNYDSFTYNLVQYLGELGQELIVHRNDKITLEQVKRLKPDRIVISPGPGTPKDAGVSQEIIRELGPKIPLLGVCLGHQCIGAVYGGVVERNYRLMHGKTSLIHHHNQGVFRGLPNPFEATRYHSLVVRRQGFPKDLEITAETKEKEIMGLRHRTFPIFGVQFHPESILTTSGKQLLRNFLKVR